MRALKTLLIIIIALLMLIAILVGVGPAETHVVRTVWVEAPAEVVYGRMNDMRRIATWDPWVELDSTAAVEVDGPEGVGSRSVWSGRKLGEGEQRLRELEPNRRVGVDLFFKEPFEATATADMELEEDGDSTRVTWRYDGINAWQGRILGLFMDMEDILGSVYAKGLDDLGRLAEQDARTAGIHNGTVSGFPIRTRERNSHVYQGRRATVKWEELEGHMAKQFPAVAEVLEKASVAVTGVATVLVYSWDTVAQRADVMVAWPVAVDAERIQGLQREELQAGKVLVIDHMGDPAGTEAAHTAMERFMAARGLRPGALVLEEFVVGASTEQDTARWHTRIVYPIAAGE